MEMCNSGEWLQPYKGQKVVIDLDSRHILIGTLMDFGDAHLVLEDTDLHDCSNANSIKEVYLAEANLHGINVNRKQVAVPRTRVLAISKLEDAQI